MRKCGNFLFQTIHNEYEKWELLGVLPETSSELLKCLAAQTVILNQGATGVPWKSFKGSAGCHAMLVLLGVQIIPRINPEI